MDARPVTWAETAHYNFIKAATDDDRIEVRAEIDRIQSGEEDVAVPVPFAYEQKSYLVSSRKWVLILEDRGEIWYLSHIEPKEG